MKKKSKRTKKVKKVARKKVKRSETNKQKALRLAKELDLVLKKC